MPDPCLIMMVCPTSQQKWFTIGIVKSWGCERLRSQMETNKNKNKTKQPVSWLSSDAISSFPSQEFTLLFSSAVSANYPKEGVVPMVLTRKQVTPTIGTIFPADKSVQFSLLWALRASPLLTLRDLQEALAPGLCLTAPESPWKAGYLAQMAARQRIAASAVFSCSCLYSVT